MRAVCKAAWIETAGEYCKPVDYLDRVCSEEHQILN
jgi:hypothetical protein